MWLNFFVGVSVLSFCVSEPFFGLFSGTDSNGCKQGFIDGILGGKRCKGSGGHMSGRYRTGEYITGEYITGEYRTGEYVTGEYRTGEYISGEYRTGETKSGEYRTGEYVSGEYVTGETKSGEYRTGEYVSREYVTGETKSREYRTGEYVYGEYVTGENKSEEYRTGEYVTGEAKSGEYRTGEYVSGKAKSGEYRTGENKSGENISGEYITGETKSGEYKTGEYVTGETKSGEYKTGEYATGETKAGEYKTGEYTTGETKSGENTPGQNVSREYKPGENMSGEYTTKEIASGKPFGQYPNGSNKNKLSILQNILPNIKNLLPPAKQIPSKFAPKSLPDGTQLSPEDQNYLINILFGKDGQMRIPSSMTLPNGHKLGPNAINYIISYMLGQLPIKPKDQNGKNLIQYVINLLPPANEIPTSYVPKSLPDGKKLSPEDQKYVLNTIFGPSNQRPNENGIPDLNGNEKNGTPPGQNTNRNNQGPSGQTPNFHNGSPSEQNLNKNNGGPEQNPNENNDSPTQQYPDGKQDNPSDQTPSRNNGNPSEQNPKENNGNGQPDVPSSISLPSGQHLGPRDIKYIIFYILGQYPANPEGQFRKPAGQYPERNNENLLPPGSEIPLSVAPNFLPDGTELNPEDQRYLIHIIFGPSAQSPGENEGSTSDQSPNKNNGSQTPKVNNANKQPRIPSSITLPDGHHLGPEAINYVVTYMLGQIPIKPQKQTGNTSDTLLQRVIRLFPSASQIPSNYAPNSLPDGKELTPEDQKYIINIIFGLPQETSNNNNMNGRPSVPTSVSLPDGQHLGKTDINYIISYILGHYPPNSDGENRKNMLNYILGQSFGSKRNGNNPKQLPGVKQSSNNNGETVYNIRVNQLPQLLGPAGNLPKSLHILKRTASQIIKTPDEELKNGKGPLSLPASISIPNMKKGSKMILNQDPKTLYYLIGVLGSKPDVIDNMKEKGNGLKSYSAPSSISDYDLQEGAKRIINLSSIQLYTVLSQLGNFPGEISSLENGPEESFNNSAKQLVNYLVNLGFFTLPNGKPSTNLSEGDQEVFQIPQTKMREILQNGGSLKGFFNNGNRGGNGVNLGLNKGNIGNLDEDLNNGGNKGKGMNAVSNGYNTVGGNKGGNLNSGGNGRNGGRTITYMLGKDMGNGAQTFEFRASQAQQILGNLTNLEGSGKDGDLINVPHSQISQVLKNLQKHLPDADIQVGNNN